MSKGVFGKRVGWNPPLRSWCRRRYQKALRQGELIPDRCEICWSHGAEGHHDDYAKPLAVRWLCRSHHRRWHHGYFLFPYPGAPYRAFLLRKAQVVTGAPGAPD